MENLAIARIFSEIADLLEIKSENPFKIRAYRNAADTIAHATERLAYCTEEQLRAIPGIGKELASKIREIAETGEARLSPRPSRAVPADHSRPAPPSRRRSQDRCPVVYAARHSHRRRARGCLQGWTGPRAQRHGLEEGATDSQGLRRAEAAFRTASPVRTPPQAAGLLLDYLRAECPAVTFVAVGSIRRGADTSGDIDILATGTDPHVMSTFTTYKLVDRVLARAKQSPASCSGAAFRPTFAWCRRKARAPRCSILPARNPTTSRFATAQWRAGSN